MAVPHLSPPSFIEAGALRFLITDCPSDESMEEYISMLKRFNVTDVIRVCEPRYSTEVLQANKIELHDIPFEDGDAPPPEVIERWLHVVESRFGSIKKKAKGAVRSKETDPCIAVHCVAGLGRAPVLVSIALMEGGMDRLDSIEFIRSKRKGAFNRKQLNFVEKYKPSHKGCVVQ